MNLKIFYKDSDCFCQKKEPKGIQQMVREKGTVIHSGRLGTAAMELQGEGKGKAFEGKKPRKVEMLGGENSQKTLEYIGDEGDNSNLFLRGGQGGTLPCCRLWRFYAVARGAEGSPENITRRHHTILEGTQSSPGTAWHWHHMCLLAILERDLHLSLVPETGQGPHTPCQSPFPPASCPGHHQSRPGSPLAFPPWALPRSLGAFERLSS